VFFVQNTSFSIDKWRWWSEADPGFATKGAYHSERGVRACKWKTGAEPPAWFGGRYFGGGQRAKPLYSWRPFVHFHTKERPKVKDLSDSLPPRPRKIASRDHDQPVLLVSGGAGPPMPGSVPWWWWWWWYCDCLFKNQTFPQYSVQIKCLSKFVVNCGKIFPSY